MQSTFTYAVFLSHNARDKPRVRKLAERLKKAGLRVWFDEWSIKPGDDIYLAVERGLEASRVQLLCLSPAALGSDWVTLERSTVLFRDPTNAERRFVPLLLADCDLPDALRRYKYLDFRDETQAALEELLGACRGEAEAAQSAPQQPSAKQSLWRRLLPLCPARLEQTRAFDWVPLRTQARFPSLSACVPLSCAVAKSVARMKRSGIRVSVRAQGHGCGGTQAPRPGFRCAASRLQGPAP